MTRARRVLWFVIMAALGLLVGLIYGWVLRSPAQANAEPANLRADYQADYVLMTAEIFAADGNLAAAQDRLAVLGAGNPVETVQAALQTAREIGYGSTDLILLETLLLRLQAEPGAGS